MVLFCWKSFLLEWALKEVWRKVEHMTHFDSDSLSFWEMVEKAEYFLSLTDKTQKLFPVLREDANLSVFYCKGRVPSGQLIVVSQKRDLLHVYKLE